MAFTLPAPTTIGLFSLTKPTWANFLAIAAALNAGFGLKQIASLPAGSSGTFTPPAAGLLFIRAIGGGASGTGHTNNTANAGSTGGQPEFCDMLPVYSDGTAITYNVGAGVAGTTGNGAGNAGNPTTISSSTFNITLAGAPAAPGGGPGGNGGGRKGAVGGALAAVGLDPVFETQFTWGGASAAGASAVAALAPLSGQTEGFTPGVGGTGDGANRASSAAPSNMFGIGNPGVSAAAGVAVQGTDATVPGMSGTGCSGGTGNPRGGNSTGGRIEIYQ